MAEMAVDAAAVASNRRRDTEMRTVMEILRLQEGGEDGGRLARDADGYVTPSTSRHELRGRLPMAQPCLRPRVLRRQDGMTIGRLMLARARFLDALSCGCRPWAFRLG